MSQLNGKKSWKSLEIASVKLTTHVVIWGVFQTHLFWYMPQYSVCVYEKERRREKKERGGRKKQSHVDTWLCIWLFWINNMIFFFLKHFLMTTSLNGWLYCNLFNKLLWNGLIFFCICNVINNVTVNDLCTYVLLLPYESTQGWFNGSKIFLVKILRLNN